MCVTRSSGPQLVDAPPWPPGEPIDVQAVGGAGRHFRRDSDRQPCRRLRQCLAQAEDTRLSEAKHTSTCCLVAGRLSERSAASTTPRPRPVPSGAPRYGRRGPRIASWPYRPRRNTPPVGEIHAPAVRPRPVTDTLWRCYALFEKFGNQPY